jgi:regulator of nucleoside diphosphate kinase
MNKVALEECDFERLSAFTLALRNKGEKEKVAALDEHLHGAVVFREGEIAWNCVTMRSCVCILDLASGQSWNYRLAFPADADVSRGRISVLSPLGASLLGRREGEEFSYDSPGGQRRVRVESVDHEY